MQNTKILEMLNNGQIEELKILIQEEVFTDGLKSKPGAKQRHAAMKKYFSYVKNNNTSLQLFEKIKIQTHFLYCIIKSAQQKLYEKR